MSSGDDPKMWESLEETPASQRPRSLSVFPTAWVYFRRWRSLRWFLLSLLPVVQSAVAALWRQGVFPAVVVGILGMACAVFLFATLATGATSSNWGTYFRTREPVRYWLDVAILSVGYVGLCLAGWFIK